MKPTARMKDSFSGLASYVRRMKDFAKTGVKVGILEGAGMHDGDGEAMTVAQIAAIHEFGMGNMPERSFIRAGTDEARPQIGRLSEHLVKGEADAVTAANQLGAFAAAKIQAKIVAGPFVPNSEATVAKKGSSRPLIDTGQMRQSVTWAVVDVDAALADGEVDVDG